MDKLCNILRTLLLSPPSCQSTLKRFTFHIHLLTKLLGQSSISDISAKYTAKASDLLKGSFMLTAHCIHKLWLHCPYSLLIYSNHPLWPYRCDKCTGTLYPGFLQNCIHTNYCELLAIYSREIHIEHSSYKSGFVILHNFGRH